MGQIEVLSPIAEIRTSQRSLARRDGTIQGKTVGFLNNRKANASLLLEHVESLLHERCGDFSALRGDKNAALAAPEEVMASLATCAVVVVAIGD